jgi:hypothetical protein
VLKQELDQAVEPGVDRDSQKAVSVVTRESQWFAFGHPRLQLEQSALATKAKEVISRRISFGSRALGSGLGVAR